MKHFKSILGLVMASTLVLTALPMGASAQEKANTSASSSASEQTAVSSDNTAQSLIGEWLLCTGSTGVAETRKFQMVKGDGKYIRWYVKNDTVDSQKTHVYLYDINKGQIVSAMSPSVDVGESRTEVFYVGSDSSLCRFKSDILPRL